MINQREVDTAIADAVAVDVVDSPVGQLTVVASDDGVRMILWPSDGRRGLRPPSVTKRRNLHLDAAVHQLAEYFDGRRTSFDVALDPLGTPFQLAAWMQLRSIPFGETISYGEQARRMGDPNKARAVGAANGRNPISIIVPCHRVVGATGGLTGFAGGIESKAYLLDLERRGARLF